MHKSFTAKVAQKFHGIKVFEPFQLEYLCEFAVLALISLNSLHRYFSSFRLIIKTEHVFNEESWLIDVLIIAIVPLLSKYSMLEQHETTHPTESSSIQYQNKKINENSLKSATLKQPFKCQNLIDCLLFSPD